MAIIVPKEKTQRKDTSAESHCSYSDQSPQANGLDASVPLPDDHRFDLRPFLYPPAFESWSFQKIDERVEALEKRASKRT
ncbi:hypothetical protein E4U41_002770 [Claviceps citrina]|nr:hypothetical protein E4U41_002770 [Claviceps citrina]